MEKPLFLTHIYLHKTSAYEDRDDPTERIFTSLYLPPLLDTNYSS